MLVLNKLGESTKITLAWVPGHQGIHDSEVADDLAKLGTLEARQVVGVPFTMGKRLIRVLMKMGTSGFVGSSSELSPSQIPTEPTPL